MNPGFEIEQLESRRLLSAAAPVPVNLAAPVTASAITPFGSDAGFTLHETAGVPFTAKVAFYPTPVLDPPLGYSASINWGDGTTTAGTWVYGANGADFGLVVSGSHNYVKAGTFTIKTQILVGPLPGSPIDVPVRVVDTITSKAIVAARPANSSGGLTIHEPAGKSFTATLGSFTTIAPGTNLRATIHWGDGSTSAGTLKPVGVIGIDVLKFNVSGTHTYTLPGTYPIHIVVTRSTVASTRPAQVIASIQSTAIVTLPLAGTLTGTYTIPPITTPDIGVLYVFTGNGTAGLLGKVSCDGSVRLPGFISSGRASGTLTLANSKGSVTLQLTGPTQAGFGTFPRTLTYKISAATGAYAGDQGTGTIAVSLISPSIATKRFTFVIS